MKFSKIKSEKDFKSFVAAATDVVDGELVDKNGKTLHPNLSMAMNYGKPVVLYAEAAALPHGTVLPANTPVIDVVGTARSIHQVDGEITLELLNCTCYEIEDMLLAEMNQTIH